MGRTINRLQLELHVADFDLVRSFYGDILGFRAIEQDPQYLIMERDGVVLNFWPGNVERLASHSYFGDANMFPAGTPRGYGVEIVVAVEDVHGFYDQVNADVTVVNELERKPWGAWDFRIADPFGYYLRITEHYDVLDYNKPARYL